MAGCVGSESVRQNYESTRVVVKDGVGLMMVIGVMGIGMVRRVVTSRQTREQEHKSEHEAAKGVHRKILPARILSTVGQGAQ